MKTTARSNSGSTLVVTIVVVATLLVLLGVAVDYSSQISRTTERTRKTAVAMEIADGHLESLFTSWRNIYRTTWTTTSSNAGGTDYSLVGTNYFLTSCATCNATPAAVAPTAVPYMSPSATPPVIPLPSSTNFPTSNYTVKQYRIQAVDPMITLDSSENSLVESNLNNKTGSSYTSMASNVVPPAGYGPNLWQYSFYYLAAVDVTVPALAGNVTAKVRRVFEKKFDQPWTYAMFYVDDLELQPSTALTITGPVHTNGSLYIGTSNFTAGSVVEYGSQYVNGYSPKDGQHSATPTAPTFAKSDPSLTISDCPPSQVSPYLPFGWNLALNSGTGNGNDDSYHEVIETPLAGADPLKYVRYYLQPGYQVVIAANTTAGGNGTYTCTWVAPPTSSSPSPTPQALSNTITTKLVGNSGNGSSSTVFNQGRFLYDTREGAWVKVTDVDVSQIVSGINGGTFPTTSGVSGQWTGVLYLSDKGATIYNADGTVKTAGTVATGTVNGAAVSTTKRAFRLINGYNTVTTSGLGLTIVSENPIYIQGNYNVSSTSGASVPSNSGTYTTPYASGYTKKACAVIADAITVLSPSWSDSASNSLLSSRGATANMTINAALVSGNVPSGAITSGSYSGGGENFIRFLEDWSNRTFCYYGSMVQLYRSNQAIGLWNGDNATVYKAPQTSKWYYDDALFSSASPPGNLQIAAYLQQQRWYQVY